ncbi:MAG: alpha,alpha-trehalase TreF [Ginsengibacter sp.]
MEIENIFSLGELFEEVQMKNIFSDGKTFIDCTPAMELASIRQRYEEEKDKPGFNLTKFINEHFILPPAYSAEYKSVDGRPIVEHIEILWDKLTRQPEVTKDSLIQLPYPYIVPGGRFTEIYYWDSYFTMLGLQVSGRIDMIRYMVNNFSFLIDNIGYIPNGNRTYYIGRSQPPFYACMIQLLSKEKGKDILVKYLPHLEKEYNFWMKGSDQLSVETLSSHRVAVLPDESILNHYWDENDTPRPESFKEDVELAHHVNDKKIIYRHLRAAAESGWDFSSRWFKDQQEFSTIHTTEIIPVDLNCLLLNLEQTIAEAYRLSNDEASSVTYQAKANKRKEAIDKYCWNNEKRFYFDYDYVAGEQKQSLTLAAVFPLFFKIASQSQADAAAQTLQQKFDVFGGLVTTTETTGQQWDSPNGWAPLHWIAIQGLVNYGHEKLAKKISKSWMSINEKVYRNTGKMMEKYNVVNADLEAGGGEYPAQDGFGWTNGVLLALLKKYGMPSEIR